MKTKQVIQLSIAGILGTQPINAAFAQSRASQVGQQALAQAEMQMLAVQAQMQRLDQSLIQLKSEIEKRSHQGVLLSNAGMLGAAAALGLSGAAAMTLRSRNQQASLIITSLIGVVAASIVSSGLVGGAVYVKEDLNTSDIRLNLIHMQNQIQMALSVVSDPAVRSVMVDLENKRNQVELEIRAYAEQSDSVQSQKVISSVLQLTGSGLLMGAILSGHRGFNVAPIVLLAGNVGQLTVLLRDDQVTEVLAAIDQLRTKLKTASYQY
jgi:hypothetical protein